VRFSGTAADDVWLDAGNDLGAAICAAAPFGARGAVLVFEGMGEFGHRFDVGDGACKLTRLSRQELIAGARPQGSPAQETSEVPTAQKPQPLDARGSAWSSAPPELRKLHHLLIDVIEKALPEEVWRAADRERLSVNVKPSGQKRLTELFPSPAALVSGLGRGDPRMVLANRHDFERCLQPILTLASAVDPVAAGEAAMTVPLRSDMVSWALAAVLGASGTETAIDRLMEAFASPMSRNIAVTGLTVARGPAVAPRLLEAFRARAAAPSDPVVQDDAAIALARLLGSRAVEAAIPDLLALFRAEREGGLRAAVADALVRIGTKEALLAVAPEVEHRQGGAQESAVRAVFLLDPAGAFDKLSPLFEEAVLASPARRQAPIIVLQILADDGSLERIPRRDATHHGFLRSDPRWADLLIRLAPNEHVGLYALLALPFLGAERAVEALVSLVGVAEIDPLCEAFRALGDRRAIPGLEAKAGTLKKKRDGNAIKKLIAELQKLG
jgi:hypothetical protein